MRTIAEVLKRQHPDKKEFLQNELQSLAIEVVELDHLQNEFNDKEEELQALAESIKSVYYQAYKKHTVVIIVPAAQQIVEQQRKENSKPPISSIGLEAPFLLRTSLEGTGLLQSRQKEKGRERMRFEQYSSLSIAAACLDRRL
jgi:hypothetical protein